MEQITLNLDTNRFPQILTRYSPERITCLLVKMCHGLNLEVNADNLYNLASHVESDLRRVFAGTH